MPACGARPELTTRAQIDGAALALEAIHAKLTVAV